MADFLLLLLLLRSPRTFSQTRILQQNCFFFSSLSFSSKNFDREEEGGGRRRGGLSHFHSKRGSWENLEEKKSFKYLFTFQISPIKERLIDNYLFI